MRAELAARNESRVIDQDTPPDALERLLSRGEIEIVTAASGELLYIRQSLDE
jgi:hypothetical protein